MSGESVQGTEDGGTGRERQEEKTSEWGVGGRQTSGEVWGPHTHTQGTPSAPSWGSLPNLWGPTSRVPGNTQTGSTGEGGVNGGGTRRAGPSGLLVLTSPHLPGKETEAQRGAATGPGLPSS